MSIKWCSYDAEGDAGNKGLIGVSIVSDREQGYYTQYSQILDRLIYHAYKGYTFVSHNAEYDIPVVFWQLHQDVQCRYYNNKFNRGIWLFDSQEKPAQIWDSLGLSGQVSLLKLGKAIHYPKLYTPRVLGGDDEEQLGWYCEKHNIMECIECYAIRDAEIVYKFMESYRDFLSEYRITPKRTIGSAAVAIWRAIEKPDKCSLPQPDIAKGHISRKNNVLESCTCNECLITLLSRQSYYGGRVDCFKIGVFETMYCADVTSMYPYVMKTKPMPDPTSLVVERKHCTEDIILKYEGVTKCTVSIPNMYIPPLPIAYNERLIFGVGVVSGVWCNCELRKAMSIGVMVKAIQIQIYSTNTVYPFSNYVSTLMQLRLDYKSIDDAREQTVKILLNSLYGRIGIREIQTEKTLFPMPKDKTHLDYPHDTVLRTPQGPQVEIEKEHYRTNPYANVMWASHITAYARLHLLSYLLLQNQSLAYCDTDSVFSLLPIIGLNIGLGELADNGLYDTAHIVGPKLYSLESMDRGSIYKAKGVPKKYAQEFLLNDTVSFSAPFKPREAARRGEIAGVWHTVPRTRRLELTKRIALDKSAYRELIGWSDTEPIVIGSDSDYYTHQERPQIHQAMLE